jgi:hypothetical protein
MNTLRALLALAALLLLVGKAVASTDDKQVEWRLLGPAASWHLQTDGATMVDRSSRVAGSTCTNVWMQGNVTITPDTLAANGLPSRICEYDSSFVQVNPRTVQYLKCDENDGKKVWLQGPLTSSGGSQFAELWGCHMEQVRRAPTWYWVNPALGLERAVRDGDWVMSVFGGYARDSYHMPSVMLGGNARYTVLQAAGLRAELGLSAGAWWRSEIKSYRNPEWSEMSMTDTWEYLQRLDREVIPVIVPMMAFEHVRSGLGVNVSWAPRITVNGQVLNAVSTFMFQTTYRF